MPLTGNGSRAGRFWAAILSRLPLLRPPAIQTGSVLLLVALSGAEAAAPGGRPWTIEDSISVRYFSVNQRNTSAWPEPGDASPVVWSPDGNYLYVISHFGDLTTDENVYEMHVYDVAQIRAALRHGPKALGPDKVFSFRSKSPDGSAINYAHWQSDSTSILFNASDANGTMQGFRVDVKDWKLLQMTHTSGEIRSFESRGKGVIFSAVHDVERMEPDPYPMTPMKWTAEGRAVLPTLQPSGKTSSYLLFGDRKVLIPGPPLLQVWLSRDGSSAIAAQFLRGSRRFVFVDLQKGSTREAFDGVIRASYTARLHVRGQGEGTPGPQAIWSDDNERVLLVGASLPGASTVTTPTDAYVLEFEPLRDRVRTVVPLEEPSTGLRVTSAAWLPRASEITVTWADPHGKRIRTTYELRQDKWEEISRKSDAAGTRPARDVEVTVVQSANQPPYLQATSGSRRLRLSSYEKELDAVKIEEVRPFTWQQSDGTPLTAGLIVPSGATGRKLPLVIQAYHYYPQFFLPDGPHSTSDAAQALAARGIAVLQMESMDLGVGTEGEGERFVARVDSVVNALSREGIIDPEKVAITGFSRGGYQVFYALTHPGEVKFTAAMCADSFTGTYSDYLANAIYGPDLHLNDFIGGGDFWSRKEQWLRQETTFNVDKVRSPLLFTLNSPTLDTVQMTTLIGAFTLNKKPLDVVLFPKGVHNLQRPRERRAALGLVVDWMGFWLQDLESREPTKVDQYERWRRLRKMQEAGS